MNLKQDNAIPNMQEDEEDIRYGIRTDSDESDHQPTTPPDVQSTSPPRGSGIGVSRNLYLYIIA
jgi:hypothetical protein